MAGRSERGETALDVFRAMQCFRNHELCRGKPMEVVGFQGLNLASVCAGLLDPSIDFVVCFRCLGDYRDRERDQFFESWAEYVPNLLKYTELSELVSLLAPRPLFLSRNDDLLSRHLTVPLFQKVRQAYEEANASAELEEQVVEPGMFLTNRSIRTFEGWLNRL